MNLSELSFLILGKGVTYNNCKEYFDKHSITYSAIKTEDISKIDSDAIFTQNSKINIHSFDYIVISPGISKKNPYVKQLIVLGCKFITDIELLQIQLKTKYICVTGTNGKTSTVNLLADILNNNDCKALACGNNGISIFKALEEEYSYVIIEVSSYQLEYIKNLNSYISVILNISEDHLERHNSLKNYLDIKFKIFKNAHNCVISSDLQISNKYQTFDVDENNFFINGDIIEELSLNDNKYIKFNEKVFQINGKHDALNLCACLSILELIGISLDDSLKGFSKRKTLSHRLERFYTYKNTIFINDSKSTNANSTLNALESTPSDITLIMGGDKKNISYSLLSNIINNKVRLLILFGDNKQDLFNQIMPDIETIFFDNLKEVVTYIFSNFKENTTVLLSPGSSSFSLYENFEQRGDHFKNLVCDYANRKI